MYELVCILWILLLESRVSIISILLSLSLLRARIIIITRTVYIYIIVLCTVCILQSMPIVLASMHTMHSIHCMHTLVEQYNMHATYSSQSSLRVRLVGFLGMGHLFERYERVSSLVYIIRSTSRTIQITLYPYQLVHIQRAYIYILQYQKELF